MSYIRRTLCVVAGTLVWSQASAAQANIPQLRGDFGILSGTLPKPGLYTGLFYSNYQVDHVIASNETALANTLPQTNYVALTLAYTFPGVILGGHWNAQVDVPWSDFAIVTPNITGTQNWSFADLYVQPVKLGWSFPLADVVTGYGVFMPTGRYHLNQTDNTGYGMWSHEFSAGSTVYLGPSKEGSVSALVKYQTQSHVKDSEKFAGQTLMVEGGVGHTLYKKTGQIGVAYYGTWKLANDQHFDVPPLYAGKNRAYGVGPEVSMPFAIENGIGNITLRYLFEYGVRTTTEGNTFLVNFNVHLPSK